MKIKDAEIVMVNAASFALDYQKSNPMSTIEETIQQVIKHLNFMRAKSDLKVYGVGAANEILKMQKQYKDKTNKQILQMFVNESSNFVNRINADPEVILEEPQVQPEVAKRLK